jgi:hypothetical protein
VALFVQPRCRAPRRWASRRQRAEALPTLRRGSRADWCAHEGKDSAVVARGLGTVQRVAPVPRISSTSLRLSTVLAWCFEGLPRWPARAPSASVRRSSTRDSATGASRFAAASGDAESATRCPRCGRCRCDGRSSPTRQRRDPAMPGCARPTTARCYPLAFALAYRLGASRRARSWATNSKPSM